MRALIAILVFALTGSAALAKDAPVSEQPVKRIAITFDDTPRHPGAYFSEDQRTRLIILKLMEAGVEQAAFFVNPGKIAEREGAEDRIAAYVAAGHVLANHTANHPRLSQTVASDYIDDVDAAGNWLSSRKSTRKWFRYPYLDEGRADKAKRDTVRAALKERGLLNAAPTIDASDWWLDSALNKAKREGASINGAAARDLFVRVHVEAAEFYHDLALETFKRPIAHNILLHETDLAALFIDDLITGLKQAGWTIITVDEAFADPAYQLPPDVPSAQGTLTELAAWHKGIESQRWYPGNDTSKLAEQFRREVLGETDESN